MKGVPESYGLRPGVRSFVTSSSRGGSPGAVDIPHERSDVVWGAIDMGP